MSQIWMLLVVLGFTGFWIFLENFYEKENFREISKKYLCKISGILFLIIIYLASNSKILTLFIGFVFLIIIYLNKNSKIYKIIKKSKGFKIYEKTLKNINTLFIYLIPIFILLILSYPDIVKESFSKIAINLSAGGIVTLILIILMKIVGYFIEENLKTLIIQAVMGLVILTVFFILNWNINFGSVALIIAIFIYIELLFSNEVIDVSIDKSKNLLKEKAKHILKEKSKWNRIVTITMNSSIIIMLFIQDKFKEEINKFVKSNLLSTKKMMLPTFYEKMFISYFVFLVWILIFLILIFFIKKPLKNHYNNRYNKEIKDQKNKKTKTLKNLKNIKNKKPRNIKNKKPKI